MEISETGLDLIKDFEGCRLEAYRCPANVWTIGYGHTKTAKRGMEISKGEAEALLRKDMARYEYAVERNVKVPLNQHQFDALVSFAFNCGEGNLKKITKYLNKGGGDYNIVPQRLMLFKKARVGGKLRTLKGLVRRRRAECELWRGLRDASDDDQGMPQEVHQEPGTPVWKTLLQSGTIRYTVTSIITAIIWFFENLLDGILKLWQLIHDPLNAIQSLTGTNFGLSVIATILIGGGLIGVIKQRLVAGSEQKTG